MKQEDISHLENLGIPINTELLYKSSFEHLLKLIRLKITNVISELEKNSNNYITLNEVPISSIIATAINQTFIFTATTEENSRGHVDITIKAPTYSGNFEYLGEAKIWRGSNYCIGGFTQLLGYITGRHPYAFTLIYFRGNICDSDFKDYIDELLISKGGAKKLQENRFTITTHIHSSSANVEIDHYAIHLPK